LTGPSAVVVDEIGDPPPEDVDPNGTSCVSSGDEEVPLAVAVDPSFAVGFSTSEWSPLTGLEKLGKVLLKPLELGGNPKLCLLLAKLNGRVEVELSVLLELRPERGCGNLDKRGRLEVTPVLVEAGGSILSCSAICWYVLDTNMTTEEASF